MTNHPKSPIKQDGEVQNPTAPQLTESEVDEIEAVNKTYRIDWRYTNHRKRVDALIRDWRALSADLQAHRELVEAFKGVLDNRQSENAALREQLAQMTKERDDRERDALALSAQLEKELRG